MKDSRTLLRVPELVKAIKPLVSIPLTPQDVFRLIGEGEIQPLGFVQRVPVFGVEQVGEIARKLQAATPRRGTILGQGGEL